MKRLNVKHRVVIGLLGLMASVVMLGFFLEIVPDKDSAVRQGRTVLAEAIAIHTTSAVLATEFNYLNDDFDRLVDRNPDLLSLALRRRWTTLGIAAGLLVASLLLLCSVRILLLTEGHSR